MINIKFKGKSTPCVDEILEENEILVAISDVIEDYRNEHHMTQKELAKALNMRQVMISKLESGQYNPTLKMLHKISRNLTNSSELLIKMLTRMKEQLTHMYVAKYDIDFFNNDEYARINDESSTEYIKVIFRDNVLKTKGDKIYGKKGTSPVSMLEKCS